MTASTVGVQATAHGVFHVPFGCKFCVFESSHIVCVPDSKQRKEAQGDAKKKKLKLKRKVLNLDSMCGVNCADRDDAQCMR